MSQPWPTMAKKDRTMFMISFQLFDNILRQIIDKFTIYTKNTVKALIWYEELDNSHIFQMRLSFYWYLSHVYKKKLRRLKHRKNNMSVAKARRTKHDQLCRNATFIFNRWLHSNRENRYLIIWSFIKSILIFNSNASSSGPMSWSCPIRFRSDWRCRACTHGVARTLGA